MRFLSRVIGASGILRARKSEEADSSKSKEHSVSSTQSLSPEDTSGADGRLSRHSSKVHLIAKNCVANFLTC